MPIKWGKWENTSKRGGEIKKIINFEKKQQKFGQGNNTVRLKMNYSYNKGY